MNATVFQKPTGFPTTLEKVKNIYIHFNLQAGILESINLDESFALLSMLYLNNNSSSTEEWLI